MPRRNPAAASTRPSRDRKGAAAPPSVLSLAGLQPALGAQVSLHLEEALPNGQTRWRVTHSIAPSPSPSPTSDPASSTPVVMATTIELTIWPDAYFTVAAMLLAGAEVIAPADRLPQVAEILRRAAATAPKSVQIPDGRKLRPRQADLDQLSALAARCVAEEPPPGSLFTARLDHPPWAQLPPAPEPLAPPPAAPAGDYLLIPSAGHYAALQQALALNTFAASDGSRFPRARLDKGGAKGFAELRPVHPEQEYVMAPEEASALARRMWEHREELSDLD